MLEFHSWWMWVAVVSTGVVGLWGVGLAATRREPGPEFRIALGISITTMLVQIAAGVVLYERGLRPADGFHVFYGVVIAVTLSIMYVYRAAMNRRPALTYGLSLLFITGLALRAWTNL